MQWNSGQNSLSGHTNSSICGAIDSAKPFQREWIWMYRSFQSKRQAAHVLSSALAPNSRLGLQLSRALFLKTFHILGKIELAKILVTAERLPNFFLPQGTLCKKRTLEKKMSKVSIFELKNSSLCNIEKFQKISLPRMDFYSNFLELAMARIVFTKTVHLYTKN